MLYYCNSLLPDAILLQLTATRCYIIATHCYQMLYYHNSLLPDAILSQLTATRCYIDSTYCYYRKYFRGAATQLLKQRSICCTILQTHFLLMYQFSKRGVQPFASYRTLGGRWVVQLCRYEF